ncbi:hypothetical protein V8G54_028717, partial [Vigna mungo]
MINTFLNGEMIQITLFNYHRKHLHHATSISTFILLRELGQPWQTPNRFSTSARPPSTLIRPPPLTVRPSCATTLHNTHLHGQRKTSIYTAQKTPKLCISSS